MESKGTAVVWTLPGTEPPEELTGALRRGGLRIERIASPYLALAHLCNLERARPADSLSASAALVLVQPEGLPHAGQVCEIVSRYAPHTRSWMYSITSGQRLRAVTPGDIEGWLGVPGGVEARPVVKSAAASKPNPDSIPILPQAKPGSRTAKTPVPGPKLRLTEEPPVDPRAETADSATGEEPPRTRQVLSPEELEMLLDDRTT
jgi:hypothetical protein